MTKAEWGNKRVCSSCGERFFDLNRSAPPCPKCGVVFELPTYQRSRKGKVSVEKVALLDDTDVLLEDDLENPLIESGLEDDLGDEVILGVDEFVDVDEEK